MKISLNWLGEYVDVSDLTPEQVAQTFTDIGLEVEGIHKQSSFQGDVVVGEVLTAVKHPNADTLRLCTVNVGEAESLAIVCGAPNARVGIKVVVARVGATLPGDFKIKKSKIRGETSEGMLCSEKELELSESHEGIIELPADAKIGAPAARALGLGDTVLELNVTPNRADCLGVIGLARDLAAKLKRPLRAPEITVVRDQGTRSAGTVSVKIHDEISCGRFVALYIKDVSPVPSPAWMQKRLVASGMRPINLLVDATNYAMLEFSQPVHAYDERSVAGRELQVRSAKAGESLTTLDGQSRRLEEGDLLICDRDGPIGLAGIMGGQTSEVRSDTRSIIVEVAWFQPQRIRRTAKRLGLHSEASHRFERGVDIDNLPNVALRVADLIAKGMREAGAKAPAVAIDHVDAYPADAQKRVVAMRLSYAKQFLGLSALSKDEATQALTSLEFDLLDSTDDRLLFEVPYFRTDIEREVDLVEEVGRMVGFEKIPYQLPVMNIRPTPEDPFIGFADDVRVALAAAGLTETVTFPFVAEKELEALGVGREHPFYPTFTLANPLSEDHRLLQTSLVPGLLRALVGNRRHGEKGARLFEVGRGYFNFGESRQVLEAFPTWRGLGRPGRFIGTRAKTDAGRPTERQWLAGALDQPYQAKSWNVAAANASFYHGKAAVLALLRAFGLEASAKLAPVEAQLVPFLHPGAAATVTVAGKLAGYVGELHPKAAHALGLSEGGSPVVFELDLEILHDAKGKGQKAAKEPGRFPPVTRDLAFLVDTAKTHADFEGAIQKFKRKQNLSRYRLFDVYQGDKLPEGKKSMAYAFTFQSAERTLADQEVDQEINALISWLSESVGAVQRA